MKNLFFYANHELSQDAFLRWLFENHDEKDAGEDIRCFSDGLLRELSGLPSTGEILVLSAQAQLKHLDVVVDFAYEGQNHHLAIEDKNDARLYNDLSKYSAEFEKARPEGVRHLAIYKTGYVVEEEKAKALAAHWPFYDLDDLVSLFQSLSHNVPPRDEVLVSYLRHIEDLQRYLSPMSSLEDLFAVPRDDKHRVGRAFIYRLAQKKYPHFTAKTAAWGGKYASIGLEIESYAGVIPTIEFKDCDCWLAGGEIHILFLIQAWNCNEIDPEKADRKRCKKRLKNPRLVYGLRERISEYASSDVPFLRGRLIAQKQPKKINNLVWKFEYVYSGEHVSEVELEEALRAFSDCYYQIVQSFLLLNPFFQ